MKKLEALTLKTKKNKNSQKKGPVSKSEVPPTELEAEQEVELEGGKQGVCATQLLQKPFKSSYFLPGKIEGRPVQFLLDTGCNTNLLSKHVFDKLPAKVQQRLESYSTHGLMADGNKLPFYGILQVSKRLRDVKFEEVLVVAILLIQS